MGTYVEVATAEVPPHGQLDASLNSELTDANLLATARDYPFSQTKNTVTGANCDTPPISVIPPVPHCEVPNTLFNNENTTNPSPRKDVPIQEAHNTSSANDPTTSMTDISRITLHTINTNLKILGLNVCGLVSKLRLNVLEDYVFDNHDILCFSETKLDAIDEANISIDGYCPFYHHRKNYHRKSGGLATFVNKAISQFVKVVKITENEFIQWLHISQKVLGYELIIGNVYIQPPDSPYSTGHEYDQIMGDLIDISIRYKDCKVCIIGDFNSRTGSLPDFLEVPDDHLLDAIGLDKHQTDIFTDRNTLQQLNIPVDRYTCDKVVDENGKKLLDFCTNTGLFIVNGRIGKEGSGGVTCKGVSLVDYTLANADLFQHINEFHVDVFDRCLSDVHCPLSLELNSQTGTEIITTQKELKPCETTHSTTTQQTKTLWDPSKQSIFKEAFNIPDISTLTTQLANIHQQPDLVTQSQIDHLTTCIEGVYKVAGETAGVIKPLPQLSRKHPATTTKYNRQVRKSSNKPWFNHECIQKRKEFFQAKNHYKKNQSTKNKHEMYLKSKTYRKAVKVANIDYHNELHSSLRNLRSENPKDYWAIINKAQGSETNQGDITLETFKSHFEHMNDTN